MCIYCGSGLESGKGESRRDFLKTTMLVGAAAAASGFMASAAHAQDAPAGTGFLAEVVRAWEASAAPAADAGIRVAFARTGIVLGSGGGALARTLPLFRLGLGGRLGSGRQWWSWISLRDEVRALIHLLEADVAGPVNLTGPEPVTNAAFTKALGAALHRPTVLPVPSFGPKLLLGSELANELLFTSARIEPRALQASGFDFEHPTVADALGWAISERR